MTCLLPPAASQPDESGAGTALERELLAVLLGLREDLALLRPLQETLSRGVERSVPAAHRPLQCDADAQGTDLLTLGISIRAMNALRRGGIHSISQLAGVREEHLRGLRNMGAASIEEIRMALQQRGLALPFSLQELRAVAPDAADHAARERVVRPEPAPPIDEAEDQRWAERIAALIDASRPELVEAEPHRNPARVLEEITSLTLEHYSGLPHRAGELQKLHAAFLAIDEAIAERPELLLQAEGLQGLLLESYRKHCSTANTATDWFKQLLRALSSSAAIIGFLRNSAGETLEAIGRDQLPPVTREAVRQSFRRLTECCGSSPRQLAQRLQPRLEEQQRQQCLASLDPWLARLGRLPFQGDEPRVAMGCPKQAQFVEQVCNLSLQQRLVLLRELDLPVTAAEWELHFQQLLGNDPRPGSGYWEAIETLRQFLPRFAELIGRPGLMPLQTSLPAIIKGAVQRHGGQSAVAKALGLTYQGQLVGENGGRTYWTEARLHDLLAQTAAQASLPAGAMPDRPQIAAFMGSGVVPEYLDKQANSVFAALSRQSTLSWQQVAERFGRRIIR
jgi:hypothetical protein